MKITYATPFSADNVHAWSGTVYYIRESLKNAGAEVATLDGLVEKGKLGGKLKELAFKHLRKKNFLRDRRPATADGYARQIEKATKGQGEQVVFSPSCLPVARLQKGVPVVFWADACFGGMIDFYPFTTNLCRETLRDGHRMEQEALDRCSLAIYASDWAAQTALEHYKVDPAKVKVVPYGANIEVERTEDQVRAAVGKRPQDRCELLFIGVEWQRKGGDIALETAVALNQRGIPTTLHLVGCEPPGEVPDFVVRHGFISKKTPEGRAKLDELLSGSHFLIVPSRAECYGLVFAEASSHGLPSLGAAVGGIPTVVSDGVNGRLFPLEARGEEYAAYVADLLADPAGYRDLALSCYAEYEKRLNWRVAGAAVLELLRGL